MTAVVATAIASANRPDPELAAEVVHDALARAGTSIARSVLLFLTEDFARHAGAAVQAAARAARCLQVLGCTAPGVFTEQDWVLDRPAACAMVFGDGLGLSTEPSHDAGPVLTLAAPAAATHQWLANAPLRLGAVATDASEPGHARVWGHGKLAEDGRVEATLHGARGVAGVSLGLRALTPPLPVTGIAGYELMRLGEQAALATLLRELPLEAREDARLPLHLLFAGIVSGEPQGALEQGRYTPAPIIGTNADQGSVLLAAPLAAGDHVFWGLRSALAAETDMRQTIETLAACVPSPDFALLFSCLGRGPYFFGGEDRDLALIKERFPALPLAGIYGTGEIGPTSGAPRILHNAAVLGLFQRV